MPRVVRHHVTIELTSPAFLRGAGDENGGVRIPSLRGVLGFWLRAAASALPGNEAIRALEAYAFGSANGGQRLRIIPCRIQNAVPAQLGNVQPSARYLGFGPVDRGQKAAPAGATYEFEFVSNRERWPFVKLSLQLLHLFGGVGARSRRAWGSCRVMVDGSAILPAAQPSETPQQ